NQDPIFLKDHNDKVTAISFTTDNTQIVAGTYTRAIKAWPTDIEQMSQQICEKVNTNISQEEWNRFVGEGIKYENTCNNLSAENTLKEEE
ncbi:MAG: WD40 repeat domain-containing protein, partial [Cyclobacteriaceae bacterium]|nr:WD40 repeat domain-containing protein [Cyclobacteriaceae bacterium]